MAGLVEHDAEPRGERARGLQSAGVLLQPRDCGQTARAMERPEHHARGDARTSCGGALRGEALVSRT